MYKLFLVLSALIVTGILSAQETVGKINPGESFTNQSEEVLFFMPRTHVVKLLNYKTKAEFDSIRVEKYKEMVGLMEMRKIEADTAISLRSYEAQYWKRELDLTDRELEQVRIDKEALRTENDRIRRSRIYYLLAGVLASSVVFIALN